MHVTGASGGDGRPPRWACAGRRVKWASWREQETLRQIRVSAAPQHEPIASFWVAPSGRPEGREFGLRISWRSILIQKWRDEQVDAPCGCPYVNMTGGDVSGSIHGQQAPPIASRALFARARDTQQAGHRCLRQWRVLPELLEHCLAWGRTHGQMFQWPSPVRYEYSWTGTYSYGT